MTWWVGDAGGAGGEDGRAGTASGYLVNMSPIESFPVHNKAETIFDRLEAHGLTWRVYCSPPARMPFTGIIHAARLQALARPLPHRRGAGLAFLARQLRPGGLGIA